MYPSIIDDRYQVLSLLSEDGEASVFHVRDPRDDHRELALKIVRHSSASVSPRRLANEYSLLRSLEHPHIVRARSYGYRDHYSYLTTDFMGNASLAALRLRTTEDLARLFLLQIATALDYMHSRSILHSDISPTNIIARNSKDGRHTAVLIDFDSTNDAKRINQSHSTAFLAPEVLHGQEHSPQADLFGLGATILHLFSTDRAEALARIQDAGLRSALQTLVSDMPSDRPRSALHLINSLEEAAPTYASSELSTRLLAHVPFQDQNELLPTISASLHDLIHKQPSSIARSGRFFLLSSEPGAGKTRTLDELRTVAETSGAVSINVSSLIQLEDELDHLGASREDSGLLDLQRPAQPSDNFWCAHYFRGFSKHEANFTPAQRSLNAPHPSHDNQRAIALELISRKIKFVAQSLPLVLLIDDLHLADPEIIETVRLVIGHQNAPLIVAAFDEASQRAEIHALRRNLAGRPSVSFLSISPFTEPLTHSFLQCTLGSEDISRQLTTYLHSLTAGNQALLHETIGQLIEDQLLTRTDKGWQIDTARLERTDLPKNLRQFSRTALMNISFREKRLLEYMALLGTPITSSRLSELLERQRSIVDQDIQSLHRQGLVRTSTLEQESLFSVKYGCIREQLLRSMDTAERLRAHQRIGCFLEQALDVAQQDIEQVAHHFLESGDRQKGPEYALRAVESALRRFATRDAISYLTKALNLIPSDRTNLRFDALHALGGLLTMVGDFPRATQQYHEMLLLARTKDRPDKEAHAIRELSEIMVEAGELSRGLAYAVDAEQRYCRLGDLAGEARSVGIQAQAERKLGHLGEAEQLARRASAKAVESGDSYVQSLAKNLLGLLANDRGDRETAVALTEEALRLKNQINDVGGMTISLNNLGVVYLDSGEVSKARPYFERARGEASGKGLVLPGILSSINLGEVDRLCGNLDNSQKRLLEAITLASASGRKQFLPYALYNLALVRLDSGFFSSAIESFSEAEGLARESGNKQDLCLVEICKARLSVLVGDIPGARRLALTALSDARDTCSVQVRSFALSTLVATTVLEEEASAGIEELLRESSAGKYEQLQGILCRASMSSAKGQLLSCLDSCNKLRALTTETGLRPDGVRGALIQGEALMRLGRRGEARRVLEGAADEAREMGLRPLLSRVLYWQAQALEALGDQRSAADCLFEASDLITSMAASIPDDEMRRGFLQVPVNLAVVERAERLERAGFSRRSVGPEAAPAPDAVAARAFEDVSRQVGADAPLRDLLTSVLDRAIEAIRADRGMVILLNGASPEVTIARNLEGETVEDATDYCRAILDDVAAGEPILVIDAPSDDRFRDRRSVRLYGILSLMCVPLRLGDSVLGALYFDSRSGHGLFRDHDLRVVQAFSNRFAEAISEARESQLVREQAIVLNRQAAQRYSMDNLIGRSDPMQNLFRKIEAVMKADCNVLVVGASGTGKELVARAVHYGGPRRLSNFIPVDCGAVPENLVESELFGHRRGAFSGAESDRRGLFEEADGGTLFLDEITNTSPVFQAKLLRALQSGEFRRLGESATRRADVRIIAATNDDIDQAIRESRFREDLYYRLNVVTLAIPPLNERGDDVLLLAEHFGRRVCEGMGIRFCGVGRGAAARLRAYPWPGNVRELEHAIEAALIVAGDGMVRRESLPDRIRGGDVEQVRDLLCQEASVGGDEGPLDEKELIENALRRSGGDKSRAARLLGWNRMRLYRRMKSLGISYEVGRS